MTEKSENLKSFAELQAVVGQGRELTQKNSKPSAAIHSSAKTKSQQCFTELSKGLSSDIKLCSQTLRELERGNLKDAYFSSTVLVNRMEKHLLKAKDGIEELSSDRKLPSLEHESIENNPYTLIVESPNHIYFHLPKMVSIQSKNRNWYHGDYLFRLIQDAIRRYNEKHKQAEFHFQKASIVFCHHVSDVTKSRGLFDADNVDAKSVTDALYPVLPEDDNVLCLTTVHTGIMDEKDFTEVHVIETVALPKLLVNIQNKR